MTNKPKWQERLDAWRPELQDKPIQACFKRSYNSEFPYITAILPHDEIALSASAFSARSIDKAAKLLTLALEMADKYDLELQGDKDASCLKLFRLMHWKNFQTGAFLTVNFEISINFEPTSADCYESNPYFMVLLDAAVNDGRYELRAPDLDDPKNISGIKSVCRKFYDFMQSALKHPDIEAPFGRFDELKSLPRVDDQDVFRISHKDRDGSIKNDRFCMLRRSIYSMPDTAPIKWIEAYSETERRMKDLKISDILKIEQETGRNQSSLSFSNVIWLCNGEWVE
jgi:hypothetical protein